MKKERDEGEIPEIWRGCVSRFDCFERGTQSEFTHWVMRAMDGDRNASKEMWRQISEGNFDNRLLIWLRGVAEMICRADELEKGNDRPAAIMAAVGLSGTYDKHRGLRRLIAAKMGFAKMNGEGLKRKELVQVVMSELGFPAEEQDVVEKIIDAQIQKINSGDAGF